MEDHVLDPFLPTSTVPADCYAYDLWPSFPQNLQIEDCSVSRKAIQAEGIAEARGTQEWK